LIPKKQIKILANDEPDYEELNEEMEDIDSDDLIDE
jgi:hypothetical protein